MSRVEPAGERATHDRGEIRDQAEIGRKRGYGVSAVRVLEPVASASRDAPPRPPTPRELSWSRWLQPLAGSVAIAILVLLTQAVSPAAPGPIDPVSVAVSTPAMVAPAATPPAKAAPFVATPNPYPSPAVETVETFVMMVNRGDSGAVLELMLDEATRPGTGTAQYPHLPTDAGLWIDGVLDRARVEGFVRYVSALPGPVDVSDCACVAGGYIATLVGCSYTTSGGVLAPLGQEPGAGRLYVVMLEGRVAGLIHPGDADADLWDRFAEWVAHTHPISALSVLGSSESGWALDPEYSRDSALEQSRLALEMAGALAVGRLATPQSPVPHPHRTRAQ